MTDDQDVRRWLLVAMVLVTLPAAARAAADEAAITRTGWWTRNPAATAPEGGLDVGMGPDGAPISLAAIEVAAGGPVTRAVLTLVEAGGITPAAASLVVCRTADEWAGGGAQPMDGAPSPACDAGKVAMTRNGASGTWAADVTPLLAGVARDGVASIMVVPVVSSSAPLGFDVQFDPPRLQSEVGAASTPTPATTSTTDPGASMTTSTTAPAPSPSTATPTTTGSDGYDPAVAAAGRIAATATAGAPTPLPQAGTPTATSAPPLPPVIENAAAVPTTGGDDDGGLPHPWWEAALAVLAADLALLARRAQRASIETKSRRSGPM